ncbi:MAG: integration host factor subunit alpha, partial [Polaromonas sp.]
MADKTLTRMDLSEAVFREVGLSRNESSALVESIL